MRVGTVGVTVAMLLVSATSSVVSIAVYDRWFAQKIVAVDIKGYIDETRELYLAKKIGIDEAIARINKLDSIEEFTKSAPKNTVVLMGDAVVRNAPIFQPR